MAARTYLTYGCCFKNPLYKSATQRPSQHDILLVTKTSFCIFFKHPFVMDFFRAPIFGQASTNRLV